jgi:parkin
MGYTLGCPVGCENSFISASSKHFAAVLTDSDSKTQANSEYDRYQRFATEEFVLQAGGVLCPQPNCGAGIMPSAESEIVSSREGQHSSERKLLCTECRYVFCRICLQGYHLGECDEMLVDEVTIKCGEKAVSTKMNISHDRSLASRARWLPEDVSTSAGELDNSGLTSSWIAIRVTTKPCPMVCLQC